MRPTLRAGVVAGVAGWRLARPGRCGPAGLSGGTVVTACCYTSEPAIHTLRRWARRPSRRAARQPRPQDAGDLAEYEHLIADVPVPGMVWRDGIIPVLER
ncbi:MAG: hypothetical protein JWN00_87 [Actinomycetia bacterium]|nr:hypothetical protein [Actinomycetes bacterium]